MKSRHTLPDWRLGCAEAAAGTGRSPTPDDPSNHAPSRATGTSLLYQHGDTPKMSHDPSAFHERSGRLT